MTPLATFMAAIAPIWAEYGDDIIRAVVDAVRSKGGEITIPRPRPLDFDEAFDMVDRKVAREGKTVAEVDALDDADDHAEWLKGES
jgi:hypothetical protein